MPQIRALLPPIGYSHIQSLPSLAASEVQTIDVHVLHRSRFLLSIMRIEFFDQLLLARFGRQPFVHTFPANNRGFAVPGVGRRYEELNRGVRRALLTL